MGDLAGAVVRLDGVRLLRDSPVAIAVTDLAGDVVFWNTAASRLYGWSADEVLGRPIADATIGPDRDHTHFMATAAAGGRRDHVFTAVHKDGRTFAATVDVTPLHDEDGTVVGLVGASRDASERIVADADARRLSALVESSAEAVISVAPDGVVLSWNTAAERLYGHQAGAVVGRSISETMPDHVWRALKTLLAEVLAGRTVADRETLGWRKDGTTFSAELRLSPIRDADGMVVAVSGIARDVTERVELRAAAEAERVRLRAAQALAHVGSRELDLTTGTVDWSPECWRILGREPRADWGMSDIVEVVHTDDRAAVTAALDLLRRGTAPEVQEFRVLRPDGELRWLREAFAVHHDDTGRAVSALGTMLDISDIRRAEDRRRTAEATLAEGFDRSRIGMMVSDPDGRSRMVNAAYLRIAGRAEAEVLGGHGGSWVHPADAEHAGRFRDQMLAGELADYELEHRVQRPDGEVRWVHKTVSVVRHDDGHPAYFLGQVQDVTERKEAEQKLAHQAFHDPLTGLPNRALLTDRVEQALARATRSGGPVAALFLDLDQFKVVNDSIGHAAGDELLVAAAARLRSVVRPGDTLARFGGDEFVLICEGLGRAGAEELGARVAKAMERPFTLAGRAVVVTVSIGIATAERVDDAGSLLRDADAAMYRAKVRGRNCSVVFDAEMHRQAQHRLDTELALRAALARHELVLHYQPVLDLASGRVRGVEALLRWHHPEQGLLHADRFVSVAEESGLIVPIGEWVLGAALEQVQRWRESVPGAAGLTVAVNVSLRQVQTPGLVEAVRSALVVSGTRPELVQLEITESVMVHDGDQGTSTLEKLQATGVRLSVDDFGTGHSSLSQLKTRPVHALKVDRSFIDGLGEADSRDRAIVRAVVMLAEAIGLEVVAEGVQRTEELAELRALGVPLGQGHLWAPAMPAEEMTRWLTEQLEG